MTSSTGGADSETRIVSPMPARQQRAERDRGLDRALERRAGLGDAEVQRVVALLGQQLVGAHHHDRVVVLDRDLEVAEAVLLEQRRLAQRRLDERLRAWPCRTSASSRLSSEPALTPMRSETPGVGRGPRDLADLVVERLDVAGVHPHRRTAGVDRGEDVLGLEVDVGDHRDLRLLRDRRQRLGVVLATGTATRTMSQPAAVSSAICCSVALTSAVSVVVIDCTDTGASPPTGDRADLDLARLAPRREDRAGARRACRAKLAHELHYPTC